MKFSRKKKIKLIIKRAFDILFSALLILILAPFLAIMYLIVMICNGKPVVFKQERIGKGGKPFTIYKFRSMIVDAEKDKPELMTGANELSDPRLTPLGSFMRKHHIDELLQLFNVIKGDGKCASIAAASIIAKVARDQLMCEYAQQYPQYGFESNKGYGSSQHQDAIREYGLTPIHRASFCSAFTQETLF
ncbi:MAG: sugar transferase [Bacteroidaceae bacterium]|nr:sugar transferase [Bacteroidaceae bacterium]